MKILSRFNKVTLNNGLTVTPVKVETMGYTENSKQVQYGFINDEGELANIGGYLETENWLKERTIYTNMQIAKSEAAFN